MKVFIVNRRSLCCLIVMMHCLSALGYRYVDIDVEHAHVEVSSWNLVDSGIVYRPKTDDRNAVLRPFISNWTADGSGGSLKFVTNPLMGAVKQRIEYYAIKNQHFDGARRYTGFNLQVGLPGWNPANITDWVLVTQWSQLGHWTSPFLAFHLREVDGELRFVVIIRNDDYHMINGIRGPLGPSLTLQSVPISVGSYNSIIAGVTPGPDGSGELLVWVNDVLVLDWAGKLGYSENLLGFPFVEMYQQSFGLYRAAQNQELIVYIDNFRIADVLAAAVP